MKRVYEFLMSNIPMVLRNSKIIASFLLAVSVPLFSIKTALNYYFNNQNFFVRITPQVYLLERLLNNRVHETDKKIYINDSTNTPGLYFSEANQANMCYFDNGEYFAYIDPFGFDIDFLVYVPQYYFGNENAINKIKYYLDKYKLFSTTYQIIFYV